MVSKEMGFIFQNDLLEKDDVFRCSTVAISDLISLCFSPLFRANNPDLFW